MFRRSSTVAPEGLKRTPRRASGIDVYKRQPYCSAVRDEYAARDIETTLV